MSLSLNGKKIKMVRTVIKELDKFNSEHEFIELSMKIYIMDNGWRKQNAPFVKSDMNGTVDDYDESESVGSDMKMRCFMLKKLVLPGYGNEDNFKGNEIDHTFDSFFGKSYRELISYMREFNFNKVDNQMYSLNFYEI